MISRALLWVVVAVVVILPPLALAIPRFARVARTPMMRRVWHWLGWSVVFGSLPLLGILAMGVFRPAPARSLDGALGGGEGTLIAVAWLAAGIAEMRDTPVRRRGSRSVLQWVASIVIAVNAVAFGATFADHSSPDAGESRAVRRRIAVVSLYDLAAAVVISAVSVAVGTPEGAL
jgi:hypothetical protein